jgi:uncharacterized phosphosugar-binding protein
MSYCHTYIEKVHHLLDEIEGNEVGKIKEAAEKMAENTRNGGINHWLAQGIPRYRHAKCSCVPGH